MVNFCTLCTSGFCSFFDIFSYVHRVLRLYGTPFVMWAGLAYPVVQTIGKSHGVSMLRERAGVYLIASDVESTREKFCF